MVRSSEVKNGVKCLVYELKGALLRDSRGKGCSMCLGGNTSSDNLKYITTFIAYAVCFACFPADLESLLQMYDQQSL